MKTKRNLIQIWLLWAVLLPAVAQAQFTFTTRNGAITITGCNVNEGAVIIPGTINGLPVTSIGDYAFYYHWGLTNVTIPNSVINIGDFVFCGCSSLTSVTIPNSVTSIGDLAFAECESLSVMTVDALNAAYCSVDGVLFNKSTNALIQCPGGKAGSYIVPNSVTNIGESAFDVCMDLTNVMIGNSVSSIRVDAFYSCIGLTSVTIPTSVTNIEENAFIYCSGLTEFTVDALNAAYSSVDGVLFNKSTNTLIQCPGGKAGNYIVPNSVTNIEDYAFYFCGSLTSVTIPNSVTNIGFGAFYDCTSLTNVTIGNSVTNIGIFAFYDCYDLTGVYLKVTRRALARGRSRVPTTQSPITCRGPRAGIALPS